MVDIVQATLLFVIVLLTMLLVILGIQVYFILKDLRKTLERANRVLENTESITESVSEPLSFLSGLVSGSKSLSSLAQIVKAIKKREQSHN